MPARRFYHVRPFLLASACAAPLIVATVAWWAVNAFVLTPGVPGDDAPIEERVRFVVHERGLPRLNQQQRTQFLEHSLRRLLRDQTLRLNFATALRRLSAEEQTTFREHLFDAFKPRVMADIQRFHALKGDAQREYLDERIVEYNRLGRSLQQARIDKSAFGGTLPDPSELTRLALARASQEEQQLGFAYATALARRIRQILADPRLQADVETRIAAALRAHAASD